MNVILSVCDRQREQEMRCSASPATLRILPLSFFHLSELVSGHLILFSTPVVDLCRGRERPRATHRYLI